MLKMFFGEILKSNGSIFLQEKIMRKTNETFFLNFFENGRFWNPRAAPPFTKRKMVSTDKGETSRGGGGREMPPPGLPGKRGVWGGVGWLGHPPPGPARPESSFRALARKRFFFGTENECESLKKKIYLKAFRKYVVPGPPQKNKEKQTPGLPPPKKKGKNQWRALKKTNNEIQCRA